ncbi:MAG: hypothetical protein PHZ02_02380 [Desulfocapsaceae bacterium]|nr:hypothetical protein [Desulfocapsaceae bacterium]
MKRNTLVLSALVGVMSLSAGLTLAADQDRLQDRDRLQTQDRLQTPDQDQDRIQDRLQMQDRDQIYGSQLMTQQERTEFRAKMRSAKTAMEREQIRNEHHLRMQERAREQGVTLPQEPPVRGGMMGTGSGMGTGGGMGSGGGGMGSGGGGMGSGGGGRGR